MDQFELRFRFQISDSDSDSDSDLDSHYSDSESDSAFVFDFDLVFVWSAFLLALQTPVFDARRSMLDAPSSMLALLGPPEHSVHHDGN